MAKTAWPQEIYQKLHICDLILVSLYVLDDRKAKITFEKLLKECLDSFPQKFNFLEYASWPDARKLDRPMRTLRKQKFILGNPKEEFSITKLGQERAVQTMNFLRQKKLGLK